MLGCRTGRRYQITSNVLSGPTLHTGWDTEVAAVPRLMSPPGPEERPYRVGLHLKTLSGVDEKVGMTVVMLFAFLACAYFAPCIVAAARHKANAGGVVLVNVFLGWTLVGWVVALAMACTGPTEGDLQAVRSVLAPHAHAKKLARLQQDYAEGLLTDKQYEKKCRQLMELTSR